jgi:KDO2-lipid IV(A) lauroyltransferase
MIAYFLFRLLVLLVAITPFWLLYRLSDLAYLLVYKLVGYRKKVVRENLRNAFPQKSVAELSLIERKFYQNLFDILVESIKGFSMSKKTLLQRQKAMDTLTQQMVDQYQSIMILGGHYANWEWIGIAASSYADCPVVILYSPLKNKYIDQYLKQSRAAQNTQFLASQQAPRAFKKYQNKEAVYVLIADQSPSNPKRAHWVNFLHQETAFLKGPSSFSRRYNLPILYLDIKRTKRGYYSVALEVLVEDPTQYTSEEITALYASKLEEKIMECPELWLWSHRRWKHKK